MAFSIFERMAGVGRRMVPATAHELLWPLDRPFQNQAARDTWVSRVLSVVIDGPPPERADLVGAVARLSPPKLAGFVDDVLVHGWPKSGRRQALPDLVLASSRFRPPGEAEASINAVTSSLEARFGDEQNGQVARDIYDSLQSAVEDMQTLR